MLLGRTDQGFVYVFDRPVRILAVDDDPLMREFAASQLAHPGGEIVTAEDGEQAWEILQEDEAGFDLVLSDLEMPNMTGFSLCEAIRSSPRHAHLPVVVITGRDDMFAIDRAYETGATSFATKPVNWRLLGYQLRYVMRAVTRDAAAPAETDANQKAQEPVPVADGEDTPPRDSGVPTLANALRSVARADENTLMALLSDPTLADDPAAIALLNRLLGGATGPCTEDAPGNRACEEPDLASPPTTGISPAPEVMEARIQEPVAEILDDSAIAGTETETPPPASVASNDESPCCAQMATRPNAESDTITRMRAQLASRADQQLAVSASGSGRISSALSFFRNRSSKRNGQQ